MQFRCLPPLLLLMLLVLCVLPAGADDGRTQPPQLLVVLNADDQAHAQATQLFRDTLPELAGSLRSLDHTSLVRADAHSASLIVTLGTRALEQTAELAPDVPIIATFLPREGYERVRQAHPQLRMTAVFLDQPPARQIATLRTALPGIDTIALIASPHSQVLADELARTAHDAGLKVRKHLIDDERQLYKALQHSLTPGPVALIMVPDSTLYNSHTIQNVLLTTYRYRAPVLGFSAAYTRAGALLSVHSSPEQVASEVARKVPPVLSGHALPTPAYSSTFDISLNPRVARSLGLPVLDEDELHSRVRSQEQRTP